MDDKIYGGTNMYDVTSYLYSLRNKGSKLGLERIRRLLEALDNPQKAFKSIVVGGTSGKGSTVAMLSSILKEAGYKAAMFTSPHLSSLTERVVVDGKRIPDGELSRIVGRIKNTVERMEGEEGFEHPTFFEVITAAAFCYFQEQGVDYAVLEVGLGGRLDATNVISPVVSVITNVSLEHTRILGNSIQEIAHEKAGIIRANGVLVTAANDEAFEVLKGICRQRSSKMMRVGTDITFTPISSTAEGQEFRVEAGGRNYYLSMPLLGRHQLENAACAIGAFYGLGSHDVNILEGAVVGGLRKVKWPGRMEIMQQRPLVMLDSAKDVQAMRRLREGVEEDLDYRRLIVVLGISSDKDIKGMVDEIVPLSDGVVITAHKMAERAAKPQAIAEKVKRHSKDFVIVDDVKDAVKKAISIAEERDLVLVTGSLFTVAEARELWAGKDDTGWGVGLNEIPKK